MNGFNFSPEQMKMASQMMQGMSNDDLSRMMGNMGMGNVDPSFVKNMATQMGGAPGGFTPPSYNPPPQYQQPQKPVETPKPKEEPLKLRYFTDNQGVTKKSKE